jgi:hypothetical protein
VFVDNLIGDQDQAAAFFSNGRGRTGIITSSGDLHYAE